MNVWIKTIRCQLVVFCVVFYFHISFNLLKNKVFNYMARLSALKMVYFHKPCLHCLHCLHSGHGMTKMLAQVLLFLHMARVIFTL